MKVFYDRALQGEKFEQAGVAGRIGSYSGIRNSEGEFVFGVIAFYGETDLT